MNESEFRDWARRAQGSFDERLKRVEEKVGSLEAGPIRFRMPGNHREFDGLLLRMKEAVSSGLATGLSFALVRSDGVVETGWVGEDYDQYALAGAVSQLHIAILDRAVHVAREAAGAAPGGTDEGRPEGAGLAGPAPAGGA